MEELRALESAYILGLVDEDMIAEEGIIKWAKDKMHDRTIKKLSKKGVNIIPRSQFQEEFLPTFFECASACREVLEDLESEMNRNGLLFTISIYGDSEDYINYNKKTVDLMLCEISSVKSHAEELTYITSDNKYDKKMNTSGIDTRPIFEKCVSKLRPIAAEYGLDVSIDPTTKKLIVLTLKNVHVDTRK